MNILVTGANGQLGNEMRRVSSVSSNQYIFTESKILLMGSSHGGLQHFITVIRSNFPTVQQMRFLLFVEQTILMIQVR